MGSGNSTTKVATNVAMIAKLKKAKKKATRKGKARTDRKNDKVDRLTPEEKEVVKLFHVGDAKGAFLHPYSAKTDNDTLLLAEVQKLLQLWMGRRLTNRQVAVIMRTIDQNSDMQVSLDEWLEMHENLSAAGQDETNLVGDSKVTDELMVRALTAGRPVMKGTAEKLLNKLFGDTAPRTRRGGAFKPNLLKLALAERHVDQHRWTDIMEGAPALSHYDIKELKGPPRIVRIYLSATTEGSKHERNVFLVDVAPAIRSLCEMMGFELQIVEMQREYGLLHVISQTHKMPGVCDKELLKSIDDSVSTCFVGFLFDCYEGAYPTEISIDLWDKIMKFVKEIGNKNLEALLLKWYTKDSNMVPVVIKLKHVSAKGCIPNIVSQSTEKRKAAQAAWEEELEKIQTGLHDISKAMLSRKLITPDEAKPLRISQVEKEMSAAVLGRYSFLDKAKVPGTILVTREFDGDPKGKTTSRAMLNSLKGKMSKAVEKHLDLGTVPWKEGGLDPFAHKEHAKYLTKFANTLHKAIAGAVFKSALDTRLASDPLFAQVSSQLSYMRSKADKFYVRNKLVENVMTACAHSLKQRSPVVVHGNAGSGKTCLVAKTIMRGIQNEVFTHHVVIVRHCGKAPFTRFPSILMRGIIEQICQVYKRDDLRSDMPVTYAEIIERFDEVLELPTKQKPLLILLDGLEQLDVEPGAEDCSWVPRKWSNPFLTILISTHSKKRDILAKLQRAISSSNLFVKVPPLNPSESTNMIKKWLESSMRVLQPFQVNGLRKFIKQADEPVSPLFACLMYQGTLAWNNAWPSQEDLANVKASGMTVASLINDLFRSLEAKFGATMMFWILGIITLSRDGIAISELEDMFSMQDEVLDSCFITGCSIVPRIPSVIVKVLLQELDFYIELRKSGSGIAAVYWAHEGFSEYAEARFTEEQKLTIYSALYDYFSGKYNAGQPYTCKKFKRNLGSDRMLPQQLLNLAGPGSTPNWNTRMIRELPHAQSKLLAVGVTYQLEELVVCDIKFVHAAVDAGLAYDVVEDYDELIVIIRGLEEMKEAEEKKVKKKKAKEKPLYKQVEQWRDFLVSKMEFFEKNPQLVMQTAWNCPSSSVVYKSVAKLKKPSFWIQHKNKTSISNPLLNRFPKGPDRLSGSTAFNADGTLILSLSDMKAGLNVVVPSTNRVVAFLPKQIGADNNDNFTHFCFSPDSTHIVGGSQTDVQIFQASCFRPQALLSWAANKMGYIACMDFSRGGRYFAVLGTKGKAMLWACDNWSKPYATWTFAREKNNDIQAFGLIFSPDSRLLFVSTNIGISVFDVIQKDDFSWNKRTKVTLQVMRNIRDMACHPHNGTLTCVDTHVHIFELKNGKRQEDFEPIEVGPSTCITYNPDGSMLVVGGKGSIQIFSTDGYRLVGTIPKFIGDIRHISFSPDGSLLAAADDKQTKAWKIASLCNTLPDGRVLPATGLKYNPISVTGTVSSISVSPDKQRFCVGSRSRANGSMVVFTLEGQEVCSMNVSANGVNCVDWATAGDFIVSAGPKQSGSGLQIWESASGELISSLNLSQSGGVAYSCCKVSYKSDTIIACTTPRGNHCMHISVWKQTGRRTWELLREVDLADITTANFNTTAEWGQIFAFTPDDERVAVVTANTSQVVLFDTQKLEVLSILNIPKVITGEVVNNVLVSRIKGQSYLRFLATSINDSGIRSTFVQEVNYTAKDPSKTKTTQLKIDVGLEILDDCWVCSLSNGLVAYTCKSEIRIVQFMRMRGQKTQTCARVLLSFTANDIITHIVAAKGNMMIVGDEHGHLYVLEVNGKIVEEQF